MHEKEKEANKRKPVAEMTSADLKARKDECQISALEKDDEPYIDQETTEKPESLGENKGKTAKEMTSAELKARVEGGMEKLCARKRGGRILQRSDSGGSWGARICRGKEMSRKRASEGA